MTTDVNFSVGFPTPSLIKKKLSYAGQGMLQTYAFQLQKHWLFKFPSLISTFPPQKRRLKKTIAP